MIENHFVNTLEPYSNPNHWKAGSKVWSNTEENYKLQTTLHKIANIIKNDLIISNYIDALSGEKAFQSIEKAIEKIESQFQILNTYANSHQQNQEIVIKNLNKMASAFLNGCKILEIYQNKLKEVSNTNLGDKEITIVITLWFRQMLNFQHEAFFFCINLQSHSNEANQKLKERISEFNDSLNKQIEFNKNYIDMTLIYYSEDYIALQLEKSKKKRAATFRALKTLGLNPFSKDSAKYLEEKVSYYFKRIKSNISLLKPFVCSFPKGGDTHCHLTGALTPNQYLELAVKKKLFFSFACSSHIKDPINADELAADENSNFYFFKEGERNKIELELNIKQNNYTAKEEWSVNKILNESRLESYFVAKASIRHKEKDKNDKFFTSFDSFESIDRNLLLSDYLSFLLERAYNENILYLEVSKGFESQFNSWDNENKKEYLEGFLKIEAFDGEKENYENELHKQLNLLLPFLEEKKRHYLDYIDRAEKEPIPEFLVKRGFKESLFFFNNPAVIRLNGDVNRELALPEFFADLALSFLIADEELTKKNENPRVLGVVMSGREHRTISLKNNRDIQLKMLGFLRSRYPKVRCSPHAGELSEKNAGIDSMMDAVSSAIEYADPSRIGHATCITYSKINDIFRKLKEKSICIEICLSSNEKILNIKKKYHPFPLLLSEKIPLTLNTDDPGVLGTSSTHEFMIAIQRYGEEISYQTLKDLARNQLRYSFLPVGEEIYENSSPYQYKLHDCFKNLHDLTKEAENILSKSQRAILQYNLEKKFLEFEGVISSNLTGPASYSPANFSSSILFFDEKRRKLSPPENQPLFLSLQNERFNFNPQKAPGKIAHNFHPNSCYVAVLLNTLRDESFKVFFQPSEPNSTIENSLTQEIKKRIGEIIRKSQNKRGMALDLCQSLFVELQDKMNNNPPLSKCENAIKDCLKKFIDQMNWDKSKYIANELLDLIKDEIKRDLQSVIGPCIDKIDQGSLTHFKKSEEGVIIVEDIKKIQNALRLYNFIERDDITDEDPIHILDRILDYLAPNDFSLMEGLETHHYNLEEVKTPEEVVLTETQLGHTGVIIVDSEGKGEKAIKCIKIALSQPDCNINISQALKDYQNNDLETEKSTVYLRFDENDNKYLKYSNVTRTKTIRTFSNAPDTLILELAGHVNQTITFDERIDFQTNDGVFHHYELNQVNCHAHAHEYAYLKYQEEWFLSDDLRPIEKGNLKPLSEDTKNICREGRAFLYKKLHRI